MYQEQQTKLGNDIKAIRKRLKLSQEGLSWKTEEAADKFPDKYIAIHKNTIGKLESGKTLKSRPKTLATIAYCLGLPDNAFEYAVKNLSDVKLLQQNAVDNYRIEQDFQKQNEFYDLDSRIQIMLSEGYSTHLIPFLNYLRYCNYDIRFKIDETSVNINNYIKSSKSGTAIEKEIKELQKTLSDLDTKCKVAYKNLVKKGLGPDEPVDECYEYQEMNANYQELSLRLENLVQQHKSFHNRSELLRIAKEDIIKTYSETYNFEKDINNIPLLVEIIKMPVLIEGDDTPSEPKIVRTVPIGEFEKLCCSIEGIIHTILEC